MEPLRTEGGTSEARWLVGSGGAASLRDRDEPGRKKLEGRDSRVRDLERERERERRLRMEAKLLRLLARPVGRSSSALGALAKLAVSAVLAGAPGRRWKEEVEEWTEDIGICREGAARPATVEARLMGGSTAEAA